MGEVTTGRDTAARGRTTLRPDSEALSGRAARRTAVASATGSIEAEGLHASDASDRDTEAYVKGDVDADTLVARAIARHRQTAERRAG
ncbi:hypothetical protein [Streptomyces sp. B21-083]|uniref:antitoxin VbhA family protein n=1 Tax=Streptomyces sp. B21-083 TaxID=3039410 RepID=UPI002FF341C1